MFIGCDPTTRAWRIYVPSTQAIHISRDVFFDETRLWYAVKSQENAPTASMHHENDFFEETRTAPSMLPEPTIPSPQTSVDEDLNMNQLSQPTPATQHRVQPIPMDVPDDGYESGDVAREEQVGGQDQTGHGVIPQQDEPLPFIANLAHCYMAPAGPTEEEARRSQSWLDAMKRELASLKRLGVYTAVPRQEGMKTIGTKWVFTMKPAEKAQGDPVYKARFVAKGYQQIYGHNYMDTWAPTVGINTLRLFIALAASARQEIYHFDVRTAFLNAKLREQNIFVEPPRGFFKEGTVLHLHRAPLV